MVFCNQDCMKLFKFFRLLFSLLSLPLLMMQNSGCAKEYSYEGGDSLIHHPPVDTLPSGGPLGEFPVCALCNQQDGTPLGTWNFKEGGSYLCGSTTNSGFMGGYDRTQFTFFGPSACSIDTGIVVSVFLPAPLDRNLQNISTDKTAFYYYDHHSAYDIFDNDPMRATFTVTVQSYVYATGVTTGTFSGTVFRPNGDSTHISEGRFKVIVKM